MPTPLTIAVAQPPSLPHDVATNAAGHARAVRSAAARVVVFPELSDALARVAQRGRGAGSILG